MIKIFYFKPNQTQYIRKYKLILNNENKDDLQDKNSDRKGELSNYRGSFFRVVWTWQHVTLKSGGNSGIDEYSYHNKI